MPAAESELGGPQATLAGLPTEEREFVDAVYGNFPYVLLFVVLLTYVLLMRAFRSVLLPLKAVILNLVSLGAAYGIIVFIFQKGHGAEEIWNVPATDSIISWIPLMIFAFLYGLSMDYEVFMLTRMREAYDETGDTAQAISLGLARTGKLVTSAALVLMFAFFVLSTSPGTDIKQFGIGLAAGIIFDATVIRALLVPSIMRLMGDWNWWLPPRARPDPPRRAELGLNGSRPEHGMRRCSRARELRRSRLRPRGCARQRRALAARARRATRARLGVPRVARARRLGDRARRAARRRGASSSPTAARRSPPGS